MNRAHLQIKLVIAVVLLAAPSLASGVTLEAYKSKVESARALALDVERSLEAGEVNYSQTRELVNNIRQNFPASDRIEWASGNVETSNSWLLERNTAFENETDLKKRLSIVVEIREYLSSVAFKLQELTEAAASSRTKDEDKQKLAEILRREEYQKAQSSKEESTFQRWLRQFLEWLESFFRSSKPAGSTSGFSGLGMILQLVLVFGILALIAFALYKIVPLFVPNLRRVKTPKKKDRVILGEKIAEDETSHDLLAEAERLAKSGNLREAVRKGYIAFLCELSDRKILGLARHKTNRDYLRDVRDRRALHPRMKTVTDTFERHWYGYQPFQPEEWDQFRAEYDRALGSI